MALSHPGIPASRHPGIPASRHPGIPASPTARGLDSRAPCVALVLGRQVLRGSFGAIGAPGVWATLAMFQTRLRGMSVRARPPLVLLGPMLEGALAG